eukprot:s291_g11.t1
MHWTFLLLAAFAVINIVVSLAFALDKLQAKRNGQRIPRWHLIWLLCVAPFLPTFVMVWLHHKVRKRLFMITSCLAGSLQTAGLLWFMFRWLPSEPREQTEQTAQTAVTVITVVVLVVLWATSLGIQLRRGCIECSSKLHEIATLCPLGITSLSAPPATLILEFCNVGISHTYAQRTSLPIPWMDFPFQSASDWREAIENKAAQLESYLKAFPDWGSCPVCEKAYPDSLGPHIAGKEHFRKLWWKIHEAPKQEWRNPSGKVITFDHLTGEIGFAWDDGPVPSAGSYTVPPEASPYPTSPSYPSYPSAEVHAEVAPLALPAPERVQDRVSAPFLEREEDLRPSKQQLDELWEQGKLYCDACGRIRLREVFHKPQQKWSLATRRCIECTERANYELSFLQCAKCRKSLLRDAFAKSVRSSNEPICRACKAEIDIESSKLICRICEQSLNRSEFRKKVEWDAPKCASCLCQKEKNAYEQFLREREEEAARQAELREEMAEEQLRENFQQRILDRMSCMRLTTYQIFQEERKNWAKRLMQNILSLEELNDQWRTETPSRDHALDREEAKRFKELEDLGDRVFKDLAYTFFEEFVMKEEEEIISSRALAQRAECRHHSLFLRGRVVACITAAGGNAVNLARAKLLDVKYHTGWKQISANELQVLQSLDMELKVKTYPEDIWRDVKDDLFEDDDRGSHNKILSRLLSMAGGTSEGSNRTETLNFCADLLGFQAPDDLKYRIWEERFLQLLEVQRVPIQYGSGKQFKLDKIWASKKEANCLEALMGSLHQAGFQQQCKALAALAALCHLAPPDLRVLVPSNWTMAEKVLANAEKMSANPELFGGDLFLRKLAWRHMDQAKLSSHMEQWLGRKAANKIG